MPGNRDISVVVGGLGEDDERAADLARMLQAALRSAGIDAHVGGRSTSSLAKGAALDWAQLVVSFTGGLPFVVQAIRGWRSRAPSTTLHIRIDDDQLDLGAVDEATETRLVEAFIQRHPG